jgi:hypothetical protein
MNHPTNDELLLLAYGELARERAAPLEAHVTTCTDCRSELAALESARGALDITMTPRRRVPWIPVGLAAAAVVGGILLARSGPTDQPRRGWSPTTEWSATAGYVAGGRAMMDIDAQLTRLEKERPYGFPE